MATSKTDSNGYSNLGSDSERDMGAKGGPTTTLGTPDANHNISHPYSSDTLTQLAAASTQNNNKNKYQNQQTNKVNEDDDNVLSEDDGDIISKD